MRALSSSKGFLNNQSVDLMSQSPDLRPNYYFSFRKSRIHFKENGFLQLKKRLMYSKCTILSASKMFLNEFAENISKNNVTYID